MHRITTAAALAVAFVGITAGVIFAQTAPSATGTSEVRIQAQRLDDGRVEFALQVRQDGEWGERILPQRRFFPATGSGRWLSSSPLTLRVDLPSATPTPTTTATRTATSTPSAALAVAPESCSGYDRSAFGSYPDVRSGSSFYLGLPITSSNRSQFHTDHVVALREACESGLPRSRWREFGSYDGNLVPAYGRLNSSKGDRDPAEWTNPNQYGQITPERWCAYIQRHVTVKQHFGLTADQAELDAINASGCATVSPGATPTPTPTATRTATPEPTPTPAPAPTATPDRARTYSSCSAVPSSVPRVQGCSRGVCPGGGRGYPAELVPSARDGDNDGVVCER